jgi:MFS family permease
VVRVGFILRRWSFVVRQLADSFIPLMLNRLIPFRRPPDAALTPAQTEANIRRLVWEIGWFGVAWGAIMNYLQVYEVRLGASSLLVGAITYGPALVSIFWQLPAAGLITRKGHRMRWVIGAGFFYRLMFLLLALIPFFMLQGRAQATAGVWVLQAIPATVSNIAFLSMMSDAIPASRIIQVVGWRMAAFGVANTATTLLGGVLLERVRFPLNFQLLFLIGFAASLVSWWHVRHIHVPDREPDRSARRPLTRELGRALRFPRFGRFLLAVGALQLALGMIAPLLPLYWVNQLDATNGQISLIMTAFSGAMVIGSLTMRRLVGKIGRERALTIGTFGYALYPLLTSVSPSVWWLLPWALLAGALNAAIVVTLFENLVSVTPEAERTNFIAVYNVAVNIALFAGPIIAAILAANGTQIVLALQVAAGVALVAGILMATRDVGVRKVTA